MELEKQGIPKLEIKSRLQLDITNRYLKKTGRKIWLKSHFHETMREYGWNKPKLIVKDWKNVKFKQVQKVREMIDVNYEFIDLLESIITSHRILRNLCNRQPIRPHISDEEIAEMKAYKTKIDSIVDGLRKKTMISNSKLFAPKVTKRHNADGKTVTSID